MYEESIKCNEKLPFNYTAYYDEIDEWEETTNNVTCAFIESVHSANTAISSNSYSMAFYSVTGAQSNMSGAQFLVFGAAVAAIGAAFITIKRRRSKTIGQDLDDSFVYGATV
jgi:hypothetical protein